LPVLVTLTFAQNTAEPTNNGNKILVTIRDKSGSPITDLKPEEVTVQDNGAAAKVLGIESAERIPVRLGILLLGNTPSFKAQQEAALQLLATLRPNLDQAFILTQATSNKSRGWPIQQLIWDPDPKGLATMVRGLRSDESLPGTTKIANQMLAADGDKAFRRVLIEFRDPSLEGMIDWGYLPYEQLEEAQLNEIADYQRQGIMVYTFAVEDPFYGHAGGPPPSETMSRENASYLAYKDGVSKIERVATMTGGRSFPPKSGNFKSEAGEIQKDLQSQFFVSFVPNAGATDKPAHTLNIRVARTDVRIVSQKGFYPTHSN
jgi:hypothetical protein